MRLFASGFNAWRQLEFPADGNDKEGKSSVDDEPNDLETFTEVLVDDHIEILFASLSCTIVKTSTGVRTAGYTDECLEKQGLGEKLMTSRAAVAGNGLVAVYDEETSTIKQHPSTFSSLRSGEGVQTTTFHEMKGITQIVAFETGFAALSSEDGRVWTWGDKRYAATLGREVTAPDSTPAKTPGLVEDLLDLPSGRIKKIAAAGYVGLALTEGNDLYAWGGHPGRRPILESISGTPEPAVVEDCDVADFAVGETHAVVLTVHGNVYVVGENTNGQLGLPSEKTAASWKKIALPLDEGEHVTGVRAGQRSSFILTENRRHSA